MGNCELLVAVEHHVRMRGAGAIDAPPADEFPADAGGS